MTVLDLWLISNPSSNQFKSHKVQQDKRKEKQKSKKLIKYPWGIVKYMKTFNEEMPWEPVGNEMQNKTQKNINKGK